MSSAIKYLHRKEIDKRAWDKCIDEASNGLIYAYSFYLDAMSDHWDALILNDYEAVMPLPWRKKFGLCYLYQPFLTAQLGLFGNNPKAELLENFLKNIPSKFKLWDFPLNQQNGFRLNHFQLYQRTNYVLDLEQPYEVLFNNYRENIKRNIKRCFQFGCYVKKNVELNEIIELNKLQAKDVSEKDYQNFSKLYQFLKDKNAAETYGIYSKQNELLASCVFTFSNNRAYYIFVGNHANGRTLGASHALIDAFIKDHAMQKLLLDFEGSDIPNLAFFYSSFGAKEESYSAIRLNRLPWYVKLFKN